MYTKGLFDRYADTIVDQVARDEFKRVAATIPFDARGFCLGGAPEQAFKGSFVDHLRIDFEGRFTEFLGNEDFAGLQSRAAQE